MIVHGTFMCNSPKLETIHMSFNGWMDPLPVVHPSYGQLLSNKKEKTWYTNNLNESPDNYADWRKQTILYDSIYIKVLKLHNFRNGDRLGSARGQGEGGGG